MLGTEWQFHLDAKCPCQVRTDHMVILDDDMKKIVEEKGIKVETNIDKSYSLFEDAAIVENKF